jgi:phosphatidylglycerol:prolipoprotein diacylglycerol transferase
MGLDKCGLTSYFDVIIGADDFEKPKPNPEGLLMACQKLYHNHDDVVYVGDSASDIVACKRMGAYSVAAAFDPKREKKLAAEKPCKIIHNMRELMDLMKEDREWSDNMI